MALVVTHLEVFKLVVEDGVGFALDVKRGVGKRFTAELQRHLFVVVAVNVAVATGPDEVAHIEVALLGHHSLKVSSSWVANARLRALVLPCNALADRWQ